MIQKVIVDSLQVWIRQHDRAGVRPWGVLIWHFSGNFWAVPLTSWWGFWLVMGCLNKPGSYFNDMVLTVLDY